MLKPKVISGIGGGTNGDVTVGVPGTNSDGSDVDSDVNVDTDANGGDGDVKANGRG